MITSSCTAALSKMLFIRELQIGARYFRSNWSVETSPFDRGFLLLHLRCTNSLKIEHAAR